MFKQLVLIVLFFISNVSADNTHKTSWTKRIKKSPAVIKVFVGIMPAIATFLSMDVVMQSYNDNPNIVAIAFYIKWAALGIACMFGNLLMKFNFYKWLNVPLSKKKMINKPDPIILQT